MPCSPSYLAALACVACGGTSVRTAEDAPPPIPEASPSQIAVAPLIDSSAAQVGVATLIDSAGVVQLGVSIGGLTPGLHGIHVHATGACVPPGFSSAGSHFNPDGRKHGILNPEGAHTGDLPNLRVGDNGSADTTFAVPVALARSGPRFLLQPGGTTLVIHAGADDERTDPSGNSGARVACGVFHAP
jgi:superoxide dismutase, Cu-Zn family